MSKTQSSVLRETQTKYGGGRNTYSEEAKSIEVNVSLTVQEVLEALRLEFPYIEFKHQKKHEKKMFAEAAGVFDHVPENPKSFVNPDGGTIFMNLGGKWLPILTTEAKKQGTNDVRSAEGLNKQALGNAIERAYKNVEEFKLLYSQYSWFNYIIFARGCDFIKGSSILDRLPALTKYQPRDTLYTFDDRQLVSLFVQPEGFTKQFVYDKMYQSSKQIVERVLQI